MTNPAPVVFTRHGIMRGAKAAIPLIIGLIPFGVVTGVASQAAGLSLLEAVVMSATVFGGAAQLLVLGTWSLPAPILAATLAALTVNLRLVLMGPLLAPWYDRLHGWRVWGSLFLLVDQNWALALRELNRGGRDAGYMFGSGVVMWLQWVILTGVGHQLGTVLSLPKGHPLFFCGLAVFVSMLAGMWRGRIDILPWIVAAAVAVSVSLLLPGTFWFIIAGALAGSLTGAIRDTLKS